ncbi:phosphotransferase [Actinospica sp.]|uniref:phosphotransferase n=1 Tax=Actinospica sp. TaxID=1872142 RepID=UPI002CC735C2|nr:phosphotransferase [Actinospica sp.]HWG26256.1 phosphotransferase [Actinospica sp.]
MTELPLLAHGRDADVYALDDARVLRRYRNPAHSNTHMEAKVMEYVGSRGYPVPRVHDATATDLVMDRLHGPTLMQAWQARPWRIARYAGQLAELHDRLGAVPAPDWLPAPWTLPERDGDAMLHLDLHPLNVILTPDRGPVVIDWTNAAAGDPAFDLARTIVTIGTADLPPSPIVAARRLYLRALRRASATDPAPRMADAARGKLAEPNTSEAEGARLRAIIARAERRRSD